MHSFREGGKKKKKEASNPGRRRLTAFLYLTNRTGQTAKQPLAEHQAAQNWLHPFKKREQNWRCTRGIDTVIFTNPLHGGQARGSLSEEPPSPRNRSTAAIRGHGRTKAGSGRPPPGSGQIQVSRLLQKAAQSLHQPQLYSSPRRRLPPAQRHSSGAHGHGKGSASPITLPSLGKPLLAGWAGHLGSQGKVFGDG